ncbi:MAG: FG-GAP-like repeat-containing protein [Myxococcota bacterium]|nr:FG-GAP-like repeat-containing protein [Myxococcota bacterium]
MWLSTMALLTGCQQVCVGVGCEEDYEAAELTVWSGSTLPQSGEADRAQAAPPIAGTEADGPHWSIAWSPGNLLIGSSTGSNVRSIATASVEQTTGDADGIIRGASSSDAFGHNIRSFADATGETALLVSAPLHSGGASSRHNGAVYAFSGLGQRFTGTFDTLDADLRINGSESGARFGETVAICPDLDGDGENEWLVAATRSSESAELGGAVVLIGSVEREAIGAQTGSAAFARRWTSGALGARAGHALLCRDDLTNDGVPDLVIGAPFADAPDGTDAVGAVYVISGAGLPEAGDLADVAVHAMYGSESNDWLGYSLATGDIDGDGSPDLIVGAPGTDNARGSVRIWLQADDLSNTPSSTLLGTADGDGFGHAVEAGDLNGDGIADLVVGAPYLNPTADQETFDAGSMFVFYGDSSWSTATSRTSDASIVGNKQYQRTGARFAVGDVDADGLADILSVQRTAAP